jgi:hypothetical protein
MEGGAVTEYRSEAAARSKRRPATLRLDLTPAEQVAIAGALQRDIRLPDTDHDTIRDLLVRLAS